MKTLGLIGAGHIGSQVARLAVAHGYNVVISNSRGPETLADLVKELGPKARAATPLDAAKAGDIVVVTIPLKNYRERPGRAARRQDRHRHEQLLPAARRAHPRARRRVDDDRRAAAGAPAEVEGRQGVQPHLRGRAHDARAARRHAEPARARHRRRRRGGEGHGHQAARRSSASTRSTRARSRRAGASSATRPATGRDATPRSCGGTSRRRSGTGTCDSGSGALGSRRRRLACPRHHVHVLPEMRNSTGRYPSPRFTKSSPFPT